LRRISKKSEWATDSEEVVCACLKGAKAGADNKHGAAEAAEGLLLAGGPEEEAAYCEDGET